MTGGVGEEKIAGGVDAYACRPTQRGYGTAVGGDGAVCLQHAQPTGCGVDEQYAAVCQYGKVADGLQSGGGGRATVAGVALFAVAGDGGERAVERETADAVVAGVGDVEVAVSSQSEAGG